MSCIDPINKTRQLTKSVRTLHNYHNAFDEEVRPNALNDGFEPLPAFVKGQSFFMLNKTGKNTCLKNGWQMVGKKKLQNKKTS